MQTNDIAGAPHDIAGAPHKEADAPEELIISSNPATGETIWQGAPDDPVAAAERGQRAWPAWAAGGLPGRLETVRSFANRVRRASDELVELMSRETGRPQWDCREEVDRADELVDVALRYQSDRAGQRRLDGRSGIEQLALRHKPHGVIAIITPFSSPCLAAMRQIIPALLAGNAIVWKPSEKAAGTAAAVARIAAESGFPEHVFQIVQGKGATAKKLVGAPTVRAICFTGSAHVGLSLAKYLAARPDKALALDMGGNNPIIAWTMNDIHAGAVQIVRSAFQSSGQRCSSARRLIVKEDMAEPLLAEVVRIAEKLIVGNPDQSPTPFMGPVIDNRMADGLTESFLALMSHGGVPLKHLVRKDDARPFLQPGIIDVTGIAEKPDIELFGPLLQVVRVDDFAAAIGEANRTRFHRVASLIGGTRAEFDQFWANSRAMRTNWNNLTHDGSPQAPVGGTGLAGNHRPGGSYMCDFVAYPVHSAENEAPRRGVIGVGIAND